MRSQRPSQDGRKTEVVRDFKAGSSGAYLKDGELS